MANPETMYERAIDRAQVGSFGSLSCRVTNDIDDLLSNLNRGRAPAIAAANIISEALNVGYSDQAAIHIAIIAAPESAFAPSAKAASTGAAGYFQLVPKYWSTSGSTTTVTVLQAQLRQILTRYKDGILSDLAVLYGTHFFPGLGVAYLRNKTLGIQAGRKTYSQYAFEDAHGSVFHSPLIMALWAVQRFEELTGVALEVDVPSLPLVITKTSGSGQRVYRDVELVTPIRYSSAAEYALDSAAADVVVTRLDTGTLGLFDTSGLSPSYGDVDWISSSDLVKVTVSDEDESLNQDRVNPFLNLFGKSGIMDFPNYFFYPSIDTLIARIRAMTVDFEIIKSTMLDMAFSDPEVGSMMTRNKTTTKPEESKASVYLRGRFRNDDDFLSFLNQFSDAELVSVLQSVLSRHLASSSFTGMAYQISSHRVALLSLRIAGFDEEEDYPDIWDITWFTYSGVLYPASLLITPSFGVEKNYLRLSIGNKYAQKLFSWTKQNASDPGTKIFLSALKQSMPRLQDPDKPRRSQ